MSEGCITTFYSYKGGVGRTMALANVAAQLARWGHRVLCIDGDLEAPGLHYYFDDAGEPADGPGLLELLTSYGRAEDRELGWTDVVRALSLRDLSAANIDLIRAGRGAGTASYGKTIDLLDWPQLYSQPGFALRLEEMCRQWRAEYDHILIDSRTGITDLGGVLTIQIPDQLLLFCTANQQGLDGLTAVARRIQEERAALPLDRPALPIMPLIASFAGRFEESLGEQWHRRFLTQLGFLHDDWINRETTAHRVLNQTRIPYVPRWSFGEDLAVLEEDRDDPERISYSLTNIAALVAHRFAHSEALVEGRQEYVLRAHSSYSPGSLGDPFAADADSIENSSRMERLSRPDRDSTGHRQVLSDARFPGPLSGHRLLAPPASVLSSLSAGTLLLLGLLWAGNVSALRLPFGDLDPWSVSAAAVLGTAVILVGCVNRPSSIWPRAWLLVLLAYNTAACTAALFPLTPEELPFAMGKAGGSEGLVHGIGQAGLMATLVLTPRLWRVSLGSRWMSRMPILAAASVGLAIAARFL